VTPRRLLPLVLIAAALPGVAAGAEQPAPRPEETPEYPALQALEREIGRLVETARPSVVSVITRAHLESLLNAFGDTSRLESPPGSGPLARRVGSGVVIDGKGHIVTVSSVVAGASEVVIVAHDGSKLSARIQGIDTASGLAVLLADESGSLRPARMSENPRIDVGSLVTTFGTDQGGGPAYSVGFVAGSGVSQGPFRRGPYLKLDAYTAPGAGGGPVFDSRGELVGLVFGARDLPSTGQDPVITWEALSPPDADDEFSSQAREYLKALHRAGSSGAGVSYAVPVDVVRHVCDQIIKSGSVRRAWLGVTIESVEPGEVRLTRVVPDSPASHSGLEEGDQIVSVDREPLSVAEALVEKIAVATPGAVVRLGIVREGRRLEVPVTLGEREPRRMAAPSGVWSFRFATPRLGVRLEEIDDTQRAQLGAPQGIGIMVRHVEEGARAAAAGLKTGDLIISALGEEVRSITDLRRALREQDEEDPMPLDVIRAGKRMVLLVPPPVPAPAPPAPPAPPRAPRAPRERP